MTNERQVFFFQGDTLLLPAETLETQTDSLETLFVPSEFANAVCAKEFKNADIFETPSLDQNTMIAGVSVPLDTVLPSDWKAIPIRQILTMSAESGKPFSHILRVSHIAKWRQDSRFCGTCGSRNADVPEQEHRQCPNCGRLEFPRICPAVIVLITDENKILLAHNKRFKEGVYSHISGFNEAGETLEETVVREIREEISIEVKDIEYVKSQPWPFPNSLMVGYKARYASGIIKPDGEEIQDARWFTKDNMPLLPSKGSLSRALIDEWLSV
ncbi:MAG: NAD(+) diphosphatase [Treponema sp.]|nr:NAD(+) diphosphatase [Treponema sp.]MCL2251459.1 NAD(+) diphosphatase [Treponema sp.]